jgi:dipeptidyl aminopeptidase/acylaminoacyl peptidase
MVARGVRSADWSPDEADFALVRVVPGGHQVEYPIGRVLARGAGMGDLRLSPDGRHLAVARHPTLGDDRGFVEILDRQGRAVATSETFGSLEGLAWAPGGGEVWFTAVGVGVKNSLQVLDLEGAERSLLQTIGRLVLHDVAPDGRLLVSRSVLRAEILFQRADQPGVVDLSWLDVSGAAALSPRGDTILFYEGGEGGGPDYTAFTRSTDGGSPPMRLGEGRALDLSPDGRWALVVPVTRPERLVLLPTGPGEARTIQGPGGMVAHDAGGWLPDGQTLFITGRDADGRRATWLVDEEGGVPHRLSLPEGRFLTRSTFSPDGAEFVARCPSPDPRPCRYPRAEGSPRPVPGAEAGWEAIRWGPQGRIYFRDRPGVGAAPSLRRVDPATGEVEVLARLAPADPTGVLTVYRVLVTPDGGAWAFNVIRRQSDLFIATLGL